MPTAGEVGERKKGDRKGNEGREERKKCFVLIWVKGRKDG